VPIEYFFLTSLTSLTSVWLWVFLATIWIFLSNNIFGVPYGAWLKAKDNENKLSELHQTTLFLAALFIKKYQITTHWFFVLIFAFIFTFWLFTGFRYGNEFLQLSFFVFLPILVLIQIRLSLANKFLIQQFNPSEIFSQIRLHRRNTRFLGFLSLVIIFCWVMFTILKQQTI
tara:strand:+ start:203 stop:718 length:516 start_codon:yes stop_codon:yes gene_type:complete